MCDPNTQHPSRTRRPNKRERFPDAPEIHNPPVLPSQRRAQSSGIGRLLVALALVWAAAIFFESFGWIGATIVTLIILYAHL